MRKEREMSKVTQATVTYVKLDDAVAVVVVWVIEVTIKVEWCLYASWLHQQSLMWIKVKYEVAILMVFLLLTASL